MAAITSKPGVEVCIWVAKDRKENYVSAFAGGLSDGQGEGRVGHASMKIFPTDAIKSTYSKLLNGKDHVYVSIRPGRFEQTFACDRDLEEEAPNAIIRLNKLDVVKMLTEFNKMIDPSKAAVPLVQPADSCPSIVYKLLEIGGIFDKAIYGKSTSYSGPYRGFYNKTNCHLGDSMGGIWNGMPWRALIISPKLILHVAASAAESDPIDKQDTLALMVSELVHKDKPTFPMGIVLGGAVAIGAVGTIAYMNSKKSGV
ncbi:MAG: hypothetical protein KAR79_05475 [Simkaniaceae bacterium]|nr:hypothetical protein [Simkaniaceae bacterium]